MQINIEYADGTTEKVVSDGSWKVAPSAMLMSEIYDGEIYDARLAQKDWASPEFNDAAWLPAVVKAFDKKNLFASNHELITAHETMQPIKILTTPKGEQVLDFGQNLVGFVRMKVSGKAGDKILLSHAEAMAKDGNLYFPNQLKYYQ